jgi:hypothetical protein
MDDQVKKSLTDILQSILPIEEYLGFVVHDLPTFKEEVEKLLKN